MGAIDPSTRRMRLRDTIGRIAKAAWSQISVIIIEDLHWLDEAGQDFSKPGSRRLKAPRS